MKQRAVADQPPLGFGLARALPGERVRVEIDGERAKLVDVLEPSADRVPAFCPHFTVCGGCAVQTFAKPAYDTWKRGLVVNALKPLIDESKIAPLVDAHGKAAQQTLPQDAPIVGSHSFEQGFEDKTLTSAVQKRTRPS